MKLLIATILSLSFVGVANAASAGQCGPTTVTVGNSESRTLNVSGQTIQAGNGNLVKLNGNNNCLIAGSRNSIKVTGSNDYVKAQGSSVTTVGANNFFDSLGRNSVNCGNSPANLTVSDSSKQCL